MSKRTGLLNWERAHVPGGLERPKVSEIIKKHFPVSTYKDVNV